MVNIKVAVRIRPLSQREILRGEEVVVRKENKCVLVTNPKISDRQDGESRNRARRFAVDFCYDFKDPESCSQEAVYNEIGLEVLRSMFEGFNACVLAYGHSASGKTYTIMGLQDDPGLTPRICQGLFDKLNEKRSDQRIQVQIVISFLEIYNEKVRDLLGSTEVGANPGNFSLRVREHPKLGPYVQGLSQHIVTDKSKLVGLLATGNRRRSTAATENNIHSSRSHAVFTIHFKQSDGENYETEKSSKVHLVDLAGSERASYSQNKARLKEGANINKSLVTLGNVISVLAGSFDSETFLNKQCSSKSWQPFVPYRDSILTWLLKDTLGGNSNTVMIATISPASGSLSETVNTLRYAKRTKRIVNQPVVNEDPKVRTIRQLREEIDRLRCLMLSLHSCGSWCELEGSLLDYKIAIPGPKTNCSDSEGRVSVIKEAGENKKKKLEKDLPEKIGIVQGEAVIANNVNEEEGKRKKAEIIVSSTTRASEYERGVVEQRAAPPGGDACKINDEKMSDVNGSVNDNFSHETQIFSDSLESFSSVSLKSENSCDADVDADEDNSRLLHLSKYASELGELSAENLRFCLMREFGSCENLSKKDFSAMLRRSRPDLIKGISTRSKERLLSGSSQSYTDLSNMSESASENSLISSGSTDKQASDKVRLPKLKKPNLKSSEAAEHRDVGAASKNYADEILPTPLKKKEKEKRSEIVNAVTSRLYVTKKKTDRRAEMSKKKDDCDEERELEELKICRRARMKLFDLSRKLAMSRRVKKTVDSDSQTDLMTTIRLKEKGVTTDESGESGAAAFEGTREESPKKDEKPCVIMNQVFIPKALNYVVECGKVVRVEAPEMTVRQETATQTLPEKGLFKNAHTSPIKFCKHDEDCFSDDSLDSEEKNRNCAQVFPAKEEKTKNELGHEGNVDFSWPSDCGGSFSRYSDTSFPTEFKIRNACQNRTESQESLIDKTPSAVSQKERTSCREVHFVPAYLSNSSLEESRKDDNPSSENSFTSVEGTDISYSSETSSEDFVFYENPKDKDSASKIKATSDRELYTITENSEQSDPSEAFSPVQSQVSFPGDRGEDEKGRKIDKLSLRQLRTDAFGIDSEMRRESNIFNRPKEATESSGHYDCDNFETKRTCKENKSKGKSLVDQSDKVNDFTKSFPLIRSKTEKSKFSTCVPFASSYVASENVDSQLTNSPASRGERGSPREGEAEKKNRNFSGARGRSEDFTTKPNHTDWKDLESRSQKQYLNLNISSSNRALPFSVDTHLFGESSQKDQSTDTMFNSSDSITFVFMGPAKPKTSVLMEIIRRSLGNSSVSTEIPFIQGKSRNRGVQVNADANLMRSVSVDTAMIALSRIAKNQEPPSDMQKSSSLGTLSSNGTSIPLEQGKLQGQRDTGCQCDFDVERLKSGKKKPSLKCSVGTSTSTDELYKNEGTNNDGAEESDITKESVSWCGETKLSESRPKALEKSAQADWDVSHRNSFEMKGKHLNEENLRRFLPSDRESGLTTERRVRFSKPETSTKEMTGQPEEGLTLFFNEAIQLLKNINFCSAKHSKLSDGTAETLGFEGNKETKENGRAVFRRYDDSESFARRKTESCWEKGPSRRWKAVAASKPDESHESHSNFTWPRRRPTLGKPPTGMKPRTSRSPFPTRSNNSLDLTASSQTAPSGQPWKTTNLTTAFSSGSLGESLEDGPSTFTSSWKYENKLPGDFYSQPNLSPRTHVPKLNFESLSELEAELQESCRRLERATEEDRVREKLLKNWNTSNEVRIEKGSDDAEEYKTGIRKRKEVIKRRKVEECLGSCTCEASKVYPCKYIWPKGCHSSFELDSFGPGSAHCQKLCMFCRKKNSEVYYSALSLNSECVSSGLCRLNFYGFCPCSSFRLSHVASSPRAYMQHLLAVRRQIVRETKQQELELPGRDERRGRYWGDQTKLSASREFS